ncbi:MAG: hypothetical protein ACRD0P_39075 [Stackebrandtia sp.]
MRATGARGRRPSPYPRPAKAQVVARKSSKNRRRYIGGLSALAIAAAVTAGFMSTSTAIAEGGDDTVTFNGNCGALGTGLFNESKPDKTELDVVDGDKITFANNLGTDATLHVGKQEYDVAEDGDKALTMKNSAEVVMVPDCATKLNDNSESATLNVSAADDDNGSGDGSGGDDGSHDGDNGSGDNGSGSGDGNSGDDEVGVPNDGNRPDGDKDPAASGQVPDPKDDASSDDDSKSDDDESAAPAPGGDTPADDTSQAGQVEAANTSGESQGASGMLALLASVCLVGVGVAAVRTMMTNRANASA